MTFERNGKFFSWRWTWRYLRITMFHDASATTLYRGPGWWSLWFGCLNIDWDSTYDTGNEEQYGA